jgi:hypothetical protein
MALRIFQAKVHHLELMQLLNDQATMLGELFPFLRELTERKDR